MRNPRLGRTYAKALMEVALEQQTADQVLSDMELLAQLCQKVADFRNLMTSPIVTSDKKDKIFQSVVGSKTSQTTQTFFKLLLRKGRENGLQDIAEQYILMYRAYKKIKTVKVITAAPVNDDFYASLEARLQSSYSGYSFVMNKAVDSSLIGGFVIEMGDKIVDASIKRDLNDIKLQFLNNIYVSNIR